VATAIVLAAALIFLFGFVVLIGAPYVPTMKAQSSAAFDLLKLQPGDSLLELGSGDGRVVKEAAKRGIYVTGIELNPVLVIWSKLITWRYRKLVTIKWGNIWSTKHWPQKTDAMYVFLLDRFMHKLDKKVAQTYTGQPVKLVSYAFEIPEKKPKQEKDGLYLYQYR
jgi:SAM-dependent methyltransferase